MVKPKHPKDFTQAEVGMFLVAIGLGNKVEAFQSAGIDGSMLVVLGGEEDAAELGVSSIQGKKLLMSVEQATAMAEGYAGDAGDTSAGETDASKVKIQDLQDENQALRTQTRDLEDEISALRHQLAAYQERDAREKAALEKAQREQEERARQQQYAAQQRQYQQQAQYSHRELSRKIRSEL
jgi:septal ring factor EnvC (AmiA/AmiB activator)